MNEYRFQLFSAGMEGMANSTANKKKGERKKKSETIIKRVKREKNFAIKATKGI